MMLSVYRQRQAIYELDHIDCVAAAGGRSDLDLIALSMRTSHPVLIGLDGESAIVKPREEGDDGLTFESLYDTCYTLTDLQRMQRRGTKTPDEAPLDTFRVDLDFIVHGTFRIKTRVRALHHGDANRIVRELFDNDPMFREAVIDQLLGIIRAHGEVAFRIADTDNHDVEDLDPAYDYDVLPDEGED
jgi:hypothetical protein